MTTIWRKLVVVAVVACILGTAGIYEIVNWLARHGVIAIAQEYRERYLTGTSVAIIVALLVLLRSGSSTGER